MPPPPQHGSRGFPAALYPMPMLKRPVLWRESLPPPLPTKICATSFTHALAFSLDSMPFTPANKSIKLNCILLLFGFYLDSIGFCCTSESLAASTTPNNTNK